MEQRYQRKIPAGRRRQNQKTPAKPRQSHQMPGWLPDPDAGLEAWGQAANRAGREMLAAYDNHLFHKSDPLSDTALGSAWELFGRTLEYAYPAGFWEGMEDLLAGNPVDLEPFIRFLEVDPFFFRSGYAKADALRGLKRAPLSADQIRRLQEVILHVVDAGFRREFRYYCRLARRIQTPDWLARVEERLASNRPGVAVRARLVLETCMQR